MEHIQHTEKKKPAEAAQKMEKGLYAQTATSDGARLSDRRTKNDDVDDELKKNNDNLW